MIQENSSGYKWFFAGLILCCILFIVVLFSFPQVSATAISLVTPQSEYSSLGLSGSEIAINPTQMSEMSDNTTHISRLYITKGSDTTHTVVRSTSKESGTVRKTSVEKYYNNETIYQSYWTTETQDMRMDLQQSTPYKFSRENGEYSIEPTPTKFNVDINEVYSIIYRDDFEWRPIRYSERYSGEVVVYGLMKMPYNSKIVPFTKYKSGRIYVDRDSGLILEAHISHNYEGEKVNIDYYSRAVPREASPYDWIRPANFE